MKQTSIDIYNEIKANGKLSKMRDHVLQAVAEVNDCFKTSHTALELSRFYTSLQRVQVRSITPRLSELVEMGLLNDSETKVCSISKNKATCYKLTGDVVPKKLIRKKSNSVIILELKEELLKVTKERDALKDNQTLHNYSARGTGIFGSVTEIDKRYELWKNGKL